MQRISSLRWQKFKSMIKESWKKIPFQTHTHSVLALVVNVVNGKSVTPDIKEAEIKATITVILGGNVKSKEQFEVIKHVEIKPTNEKLEQVVGIV